MDCLEHTMTRLPQLALNQPSYEARDNHIIHLRFNAYGRRANPFILMKFHVYNRHPYYTINGALYVR